MTALEFSVRSPGDLLAYLSYRLGFRPRNCLLVAALRPPDGNVGVVVRMDLENCADDDGTALVVRQLLLDGASAAVVAVHCDACHDPTRPPRGAAEAATRIRAVLADQGIESQVWVVGPHSYACLDCGRGCCPPGARALDEIDYGALAARLVVAGMSLAPTRAEGLALAPVSAEARGRARWAACRTRAHFEDAGRLRSGRAGRLWALRSAALADWRRLLVSGRADPVRCGRVGAAVHDPRTRDAMLLVAMGGHEDLADRTVAGENVEPQTAAAISTLLDPSAAATPMERTGRAVAVAEAVAAHAEPAQAAPALALAALLAWWRGDGARANERVGEALDAEPGYRLAQLVDGALRGGVPPAWVVARHRTGAAVR